MFFVRVNKFSVINGFQESQFGFPFYAFAYLIFIFYVAKIKAFGDEIECLRIRKKKPKSKKLPELLPSDTNNWNKVIAGLQNGYTIDQVKTRWSISKKNEELLLTESI